MDGYVCSREKICVREGSISNPERIDDTDAMPASDRDAEPVAKPKPPSNEGNTAARTDAGSSEPQPTAADASTSTPRESAPDAGETAPAEPTTPVVPSEPAAPAAGADASTSEEPLQPSAAGATAPPACEVGTLCSAACVSLESDVEHCGSCGTRCPAPQGGTAVCVAGRCTGTCPGGRTACGDECVDLASDSENCGACARICSKKGTLAVCERGACTDSCPSGTTDCEGKCVDVLADDHHCGGCNERCEGRERCAQGRCEPNERNDEKEDD